MSQNKTDAESQIGSWNIIRKILLPMMLFLILVLIKINLPLAITQPIRIDDVVIVENEWGWIEEINLTHIVVKVWDMRRLIVPPSYFIEKPFQNWTRTSASILGTVFIYADYKAPIQAIRDELQRILDNTDLWDKKVCNLRLQILPVKRSRSEP